MTEKFKNLFKKIEDLENKNKIYDKFYIPEFKIFAFFKAIQQNIAELEKFKNYLSKGRDGVNGHYSDEFLVVALIFRSFFQISTVNVGKVISADENQSLSKAFKLLSTKTDVSCDHLNKIKRLFLPIKNEFERFILDLEEKYISILQRSMPDYYRSVRVKSGGELVPSAEKILDLVPWHKYFPDSIFEWDEYYSPILMYKTLVWSRLKKIDGCIQIRNALREEIESKNGHFRRFGQNLGFIDSIPEKSKLYDFFKNLKNSVLDKTIETHARILIRRNTAEPLILTADSSSAKGQNDDPGFSDDVQENSNRKKTHKIHAVCDGIGIPLLIHRTQGEMNDMIGFNLYKPELLRLKEIADEENRKVIALALDAGFASTENITWIKQNLKVEPIVWPRNPRGGELKMLLHWLENLRKRFRRLKKLKRNTSPDALLKDKVYCNIIKAIEWICTELQASEYDYAKFIANYLLEIGIHKWFTLYRRRSTIEGTFGIMKSSYHLLKRTPSQSLPVTGAENVEKHAALVIIAMQINALYRYLMLQKDSGILKPTLAFTLKELEVDL